MKLFKASYLFFILVMTFSCSGDDGDTGSVGGLEVTIHSPTDNDIFNMGETIILSYTVTDDERVTTIAWDTKNEFGTGSVQGSELPVGTTEYSGDFMIIADAEPGTYEIQVIATDAGFEHVVTKTVDVVIQ